MAVAAMGTMGFVAVAVSMVHEQFGGTHQQIGFVVGVWTAMQASTGDFIHALPPLERRTRRAGRLATLFHQVPSPAKYSLEHRST